MTASDLAELESKKARLLAGMLDYINPNDEDRVVDFVPTYTEADVKKCDRILNTFTQKLQQQCDATLPDGQILDCVKDVVLDLNKLNDAAGGQLIETDQREDLCDYILFAAQRAGLTKDDDVTEEWREW